MAMALFAIFCWCITLTIFAYKAVECLMISKAPKKAYEPESLKPYRVAEPSSKNFRPLEYNKPKKNKKGKTVAPVISNAELARRWMQENADYLTELIKPSYEDKTSVIGKDRLGSLPNEAKQQIVQFLDQIYAEIQICGLNPDGEIVLKTGN